MPDSTATPRRPLVLHIRRYRQWYGTRQMSQEELSSLTGLSVRRLRDLEACRDLPKGIQSLIDIALALRLSVEDLVSPDHIEDRKAEIEARRLELFGPEDQEEEHDELWDLQPVIEPPS